MFRKRKKMVSFVLILLMLIQPFGVYAEESGVEDVNDAVYADSLDSEIQNLYDDVETEEPQEETNNLDGNAVDNSIEGNESQDVPGNANDDTGLQEKADETAEGEKQNSLEEENSQNESTVVTDEDKVEAENNEDSADKQIIPQIRYRAHVQNIGWQSEVSSGKAGTEGRKLNMEAFQLFLNNQTEFEGNVEYRAHVQNIGWQSAVAAGNIAGTTGKSLRMEAFQMNLSGELKEHFDIYYRVHSANYGWLGWAKNGMTAGTIGMGLRAEAIEVKIVAKDSNDKPVESGLSYISEETLGNVLTRSHVKNIGWQSSVYDGKTAGTTGRKLNLEAFQVKVTELGRKFQYSGSVFYRSYVSGDGWQSEVSDGATAGTVGQKKAIEAVSIRLTDQLQENYDIYYRVHSANYGWLGWAKNGEKAGVVGYDCNAEAIEVKIFEKNASNAPNQNKKAYISYDEIGDIIYRTHSRYIGWQGYKHDGAMAGTEGEGLQIEGIRIHLSEKLTEGKSGTLLYQAHIQDIGWQGEVSDGRLAGTVEQNRRIEAIKIRLTEELESTYDIYYRVHAANYGWLGWTKNGAPAGTSGSFRAIEAIQIKLYPKDSADAPAITGRAYLGEGLIPHLRYQSHVQNIGWQGEKGNGETSGTIGESKRVEAFRIHLNSDNMENAYQGDVEYQAHVGYDGWQTWKKNGEDAGTVGQSKKVEAIKIRLTGELQQYADVYYRTHVENYGWLGWASNGQAAGTTKCGYRIEAIQIQIVPKFAPAPGSTYMCYTETPYKSVIGSFSTKCTNVYASWFNMSKALSAFDGLKIRPGETVSFFGVAGPCSAAQGYMMAPVVGGLGYGGGICQASTTLYGAAIRAGLTIVERRNHSVPSTYVPLGQDAMVSWGTSDLKFRNDTGHEIELNTSAVNDMLTVEIYGRQPDWYDHIAVYSWSTGFGSAAAERIYYKNGQEVKRERLPNSYYY